MIDNIFSDFQKIDQVQVPASDKTVNKIKKTYHAILKLLETGLYMYMLVLK